MKKKYVYLTLFGLAILSAIWFAANAVFESALGEK